MGLDSMMTRGDYGVQEQNSSTLAETNARLDQLEEDGDLEVDLADPQLARITRLRLISDPGFPFWDVSYCHGVLKDGRTCRVYLPEHQFPKRGLSHAIVEMCKQEKVYAKGLGLLDPENISMLV